MPCQGNAWSGGGCLVQGGGGLGGLLLGDGGGISACTEADPPSREQNHTHVLKHNLAPTSLRVVTMGLIL